MSIPHCSLQMVQALELDLHLHITVLAKAGDFVEIPASVAKFAVSADKKILVAECMVGQGGGYGESKVKPALPP
ncbi:MAG: hypothetical protein R3B09_08785 [Nannocystaceae bacterium]